MHTIKYKSIPSEELLTEEQIQNIDFYLKCYYNGSIIEKAEWISSDKVKGVIIYNNESNQHAAIVDTNLLASYDWIAIVDIESFYEGYELSTKHYYSSNGILKGKLLRLKDANGDIVAGQPQDSNGVPDYEATHKHYWDRNINPDNELFECFYDPVTGIFQELIWNNEHINDYGESAFSLFNVQDPAISVHRILGLTGMSQSLLDYYLSPEVRPNF